MNPADLALPAISPTLTSKNLSISTSLLQKSGKAPVPRVDLEPTYLQLKSALGDHWTEYKTAINHFVLGNLNQAELTWVLQPLLAGSSTIITNTAALTSTIPLNQLHNQLVTCIYANVTRDPPATEVAPWVVATDKPSAAKNAGAIGASDKAEERLKREIMALHARDRRRIKTLKADANARSDGTLKDMQDYRYELAVKPVESGAQTSGLSKSNWDLETRRKYVQSLAAETLEFPSQAEMQTRIEPICYDEGLIGAAQGTLQACAELMEQAAEAYIKTVVGELQVHSQSNGVDCIQTAKYRGQLRKEEDEVERGVLQRNPAGLLPAECETLAKKEPIAQFDLRLAFEMKDALLMHERFLAGKIALDEWPILSDQVIDQPLVKSVANGLSSVSDDHDAMDIDDDSTWRGASMLDQDTLMGVLDDCLAVA